MNDNELQLKYETMFILDERECKKILDEITKEEYESKQANQNIKVNSI